MWIDYLANGVCLFYAVLLFTVCMSLRSTIMCKIGFINFITSK